MSIRRSLIVVFALGLTLAACSSGDDTTGATGSTGGSSPTAAPSPTPTERPGSPSETPSADRRTEIETDDSAFGPILTDQRGNTLYAFLPDEQGPSTCYDDCAATWPPLMAKGELEVSGNDDDPTDAVLLGTAPRDDGGLQVTYNGWPLYRFSSDQGPGDTNGQGVGEVWYVVSPEGEPVTG